MRFIRERKEKVREKEDEKKGDLIDRDRRKERKRCGEKDGEIENRTDGERGEEEGERIDGQRMRTIQCFKCSWCTCYPTHINYNTIYKRCSFRVNFGLYII